MIYYTHLLSLSVLSLVILLIKCTDVQIMYFFNGECSQTRRSEEFPPSLMIKLHSLLVDYIFLIIIRSLQGKSQGWRKFLDKKKKIK